MSVIKLLLFPLTFDMPQTRRNRWRFIACELAGGIWGIWCLYDTLPVWQGFLIGYGLTRLFAGLLRLTPFAKSEMLE